MTIESGEKIVATTEGVYRVGGVLRCAADQRWSADMMGKFDGSLSEPKPGSGSDKIPTYPKPGSERPSSRREVQDAAWDCWIAGTPSLHQHQRRGQRSVARLHGVQYGFSTKTRNGLCPYSGMPIEIREQLQERQSGASTSSRRANGRSSVPRVRLRG